MRACSKELYLELARMCDTGQCPLFKSKEDPPIQLPFDDFRTQQIFQGSLAAEHTNVCHVQHVQSLRKSDSCCLRMPSPSGPATYTDTKTTESNTKYNMMQPWRQTTVSKSLAQPGGQFPPLKALLPCSTAGRLQLCKLPCTPTLQKNLSLGQQ